MIRVRFAPSPTGELHLGSLRTALYNYLFAKKNNGSLILRIDDTDQSRIVPNVISNIISTLDKVGLYFDEGPGRNEIYGAYLQSKRINIYQEHINYLLDHGQAYHCFCSQNRLNKLRLIQNKQGYPVKYDGFCRKLSKEETSSRINNSETFVIRLKIPDSHNQSLLCSDQIMGKIYFQYSTLTDHILMKSDGYPTYHLASVIDDHLMNISHVIRGEEWLLSTPYHQLLHSFFGWSCPFYGHLPILIDKNKQKLSKKRGDLSINSLMTQYLPNSILNFCFSLGLSTKNQILSLSDMIENFSIDKLKNSRCQVDLDKLRYLNRKQIKSMIISTNKEELISFFRSSPSFNIPSSLYLSSNYLFNIIKLLADRISNVDDLVSYSRYFFQHPPLSSLGSLSLNPFQYSSLSHLSLLLNSLDIEIVIDTCKEIAKEQNFSIKDLLYPLRIIITGENVGPSLHNIMKLLGKEKVIFRIQRALEYLKKEGIS